MKKDIIALFVVFIGIIILINGVEIQSVDEYYLEHIDDITPDSKTVTLEIQCKDILLNYDMLDDSLKSEKYVPADGEIIPETKYVLRDKDTVFDVAERAVRHEKIPFDYQGASENAFGTVYIKGINGIYEYSCGAASGWAYMVNGEIPNKGCDKYLLSDGDNVVFYYVCDYSKEGGYEDK